MNHNEKAIMIAMRKNEKLTTQGDVKRHKKKVEVSNTAAIPNRTLVLPDTKKTDKALEQNESTPKATPIDKRRVNDIRRAIGKGDYKINCHRTAEKLLQLEKDVWGDK